MKKRGINDLLGLLLLAVFAVSVLAVLATGAGVYERLVERDDAAYSSRTAAQYLSAKVHQASTPAAVEAGDFEGVPALVLRENYAGLTFLTRVYAYDGYLRELFCLEGEDFHPADGEKVLPLTALETETRGNLLYLTCVDAAHGRQTLILSLDGKEATP